MTELAFHFNVPDKLAYSCRLLRKAWGSGARVVVTGEAEMLDRLDQLLWTFSPLEFVPHCRLEAPPATLAVTPVLLAGALDACPHHEVLVNLGGQVPVGFERFERLIELVTPADDDRQAARARWKHYADRGYAMKRHDLAAESRA
jgi:DNA polymerase-3 subunit chi